MPESFAREALERASAWDPARVEALLARTHQSVARRRRQRAIGLATAAMLVVGAGVASYLTLRTVGDGHRELVVGDQAVDEGAIASAAGWSMAIGASQVALLRGGTDVRALPDQDGRSGFELVEGGVRVDAVSLRVLVAGQWLVADRARFELVLDGAGFELRVEDGLVHFGEREFGPGTQLVFDPSAIPAASDAGTTGSAAIEPAVADDDEAPSARPRPKPAKPKWRALVQSRDWAEAYTEMKRADPKTVRASVDALMAAADAARFGGHPDEAPSYLDEVIDDHARHAMAPLAAFTLGRVYLEQLGSGAKAARAFAKARALAPGGALAADALAREVEAWAKAGETDKARARAQEYLAAHPDGRRVAAVRRHAGLTEP